MILDLFRKENQFYNIQGYDDIVRRALDAEDNYNLLFIGPLILDPSTAGFSAGYLGIPLKGHHTQ